MPLFTFVCESCRKTSELLVRAGDHPACPHCGKKKLIKQASAISPRMGDSGPIGNLPPSCEACCSRRDGTCPKL